MQMLKQIVRRGFAHVPGDFPFGKPDITVSNVWTAKKRIEKLRYMHRNPVKRGLVEKPEDWAWSSFVHNVAGVEGAVEIESE